MKLKAIMAIAITMSIGIAGCTVSEGSPDDVDSLFTAPVEDDDGSIGSLFEPPAEKDPGATDSGDEDLDDDQDKDKDVDQDTELNPLTISGDDEIEVGAFAEFEQIYSARGGNEEEYDWVISGAPEWVEHELQGDHRIIIRGKAPFLMVDKSFSLELTATDAKDDSLEVTEEITVKVLGANIEPIQAEFYGSQCEEPLKIHIEKNTTKEGNGEPLSAKKVVIGTAGQNIVLNVTRGDDKAPVGKVTWSWESRVDESYYCRTDNRKGIAGAIDRFDDIKYIGRAYPIGNDAYYPITLDGDDYTFGEECVGDDEGQWTRNYSWRLSSEGPGDGKAQRDVDTDNDTLSLTGDFIFPEQPMPVLKFYDDGVEDLDSKPVERLTVTVSDGCEAGDTGEIELEFHLEYPKDKVSDIRVELAYENAQSYDKEAHSSDDCKDPQSTGRCEAFSHSNISLHLFYEDPDEVLETGFNSLLDNSIAFSAYRLQELEEKGDGSVAQRVTSQEKNMTIHNVRHMKLRTDGVGKIEEKWVCPIWFCFKMDEHKYDDIDIKSIDLETSYWETGYFDADDSDEWTWDKDKLHDYPDMYDLSDSNEMDPRNSDGGIFHRKTWLPKKFVESSFEAELTMD